MRTIEDIEKTTCEFRKLESKDLHVKRRWRRLNNVRQEVMFFAQLEGYSDEEAGAFYGLDRCTAWHAKKTINGLIDVDKNYCKEIETLAGKITNDPNYLIEVMANRIFELKQEASNIEKKVIELKTELNQIQKTAV